MSLYTPWAPSGLSPSDHSHLLESKNRNVSWAEDRKAGIVRLAMNLTSLDRQSHGPVANLPGLRDLFTAQHLPQPTPTAWASTTPSDPSFYCHSISQKGTRYVNVPRPPCHPTPPHLALRRPSLPQVHRHFRGGSSPIAPPCQVGQRFRALDEVSHLSPTPSPTSFYIIPSYGLQGGDIPRRSKAAIATEDWDHPSFARPPHRPIETKAKMAESCWEPHHSSNLNDSSRHISSPLKSDEEEPLVPNSYPVPPPPPYEHSAAPLADLASEMVWERCFPAKPRVAAPSSGFHDSLRESVLPWSSARMHSASHRVGPQQCPQTHPSFKSDASFADWVSPANMFGVIGAEAKARKFCRGANSSLHDSSPSGILPLSTESRKAIPGAKSEVKPAFRRWTRQVLEQTLLSPQVLVLALYYVDSVSGVDVFGDHNAKASLLPYKMLLAALVLANKTLDDHSYKNSTFANVSSMTNAEVNTIEVGLLKALNFRIVPTTGQWSKWLETVSVIADRAGFNLADAGLRSASAGLATSPLLKLTDTMACSKHPSSEVPRARSIFDQSHGFHPPGDLYNQVHSSNVWGRATHPPVPTRQAHMAIDSNRTMEAYHHPSYSKAELYRDQLRGSMTFDLGFEADLAYAQRAHPIFG